MTWRSAAIAIGGPVCDSRRTMTATAERTEQLEQLERIPDDLDAETYLHDHAPVGGPAYGRREVTADEYTFFRREGFLVVRGLIPPADVDELDQHTKDLMAGRLPEQQEMEETDALKSGKRFDGGKEVGLRNLFRPPEGLSDEQKAAMFLRIHMLHRHLPLHERFLLHPRVLDVLEVIIGPDVLSLQSMLFLKPPGKVGQGWHQDSYYIPTYPDTLCGAWIAVDDADEYNGALWMAKGTNHGPVYPPCPESGYGFGDRLVKDLTHTVGASDPRDEQNTLSQVTDKHDQVLVSVKKGDVVFFNGHVIHRSKDNVTKDRFRRAFVGHYCNARSYTLWGGSGDEGEGGTNGKHILARGDTHLPFARPKFGTPCAAMLPDDLRRGHHDGIARTLAAHGAGLMGCGIGVPDDHDHDAPAMDGGMMG